MTFDLDLSSLPALLAALGKGQQLALLTADGVTWTAIVTSPGLAAAGITPAADPQGAYSALVGRASTAAATALQAATATASAVATVAKAVPVGPPQQDQPAQPIGGAAKETP